MDSESETLKSGSSSDISMEYEATNSMEYEAIKHVPRFYKMKKQGFLKFIYHIFKLGFNLNYESNEYLLKDFSPSENHTILFDHVNPFLKS